MTAANRITAPTLVAMLLFVFAFDARGQTLSPAMPTKEQLANDNNLFISLARKHLKWDEPEEPGRIIGPIYFVGTKGLGAFLFTTSEGHILMNTGMPPSGPMMAESIRKLGFKPEDIKIMINGHAHVDHAGAFAFFKKLSGAQVAIMIDDVPLIENGGRGDFKYGNDFVYEGVKVDRSLRNGDTVSLGDLLFTAYHTPGHTKGATTWILNMVVNGKAYVVAFPDGAGFNPGYRLAKEPIYPGINSDFRRTHHFLEMLKPDIWLAQHNEYYDLEGKRKRALTEGDNAWTDPEGYRRFIAGKKRAFEDEVDLEMGAANAPPR